MRVSEQWLMTSQNAHLSNYEDTAVSATALIQGPVLAIIVFRICALTAPHWGLTQVDCLYPHEYSNCPTPDFTLLPQHISASGISILLAGRVIILSRTSALIKC